MSGGAYVFYNVGGTGVRFKDNIIEKDSWKWEGGRVYPKNSSLVHECNQYQDGTPISQNPPCEKSGESIEIKPIAWKGYSAAVALTFAAGPRYLIACKGQGLRHACTTF